MAVLPTESVETKECLCKKSSKAKSSSKTLSGSRDFRTEDPQRMPPLEEATRQHNERIAMVGSASGEFDGERLRVISELSLSLGLSKFLMPA